MDIPTGHVGTDTQGIGGVGDAPCCRVVSLSGQGRDSRKHEPGGRVPRPSPELPGLGGGGEGRGGGEGGEERVGEVRRVGVAELGTAGEEDIGPYRGGHQRSKSVSQAEGQALFLPPACKPQV